MGLFYMQTFLRKSISNKMFHFDYKHITDKLPDSLIRRVYQGLLNHSKNPVLLEMISGKSSRIESYPFFGHRPSGEKLTIIFFYSDFKENILQNS